MTGTNLDAPTSFINPPLTPSEKIGGYPRSYELDLDENDPSGMDLRRLDLEGRAVVLDLGLFVLINVYCPHETNDERLAFKVSMRLFSSMLRRERRRADTAPPPSRPRQMNFLKVLEARMKSLVAAGREVMIVGDMNVVHMPLDHGEGSLASKQDVFWNHPVRTVVSFFSPVQT